MKNTLNNISWFAGFFDGEGSIMLSICHLDSKTHKIEFRARVAVGNTNEESIELFCKKWPTKMKRTKTPNPYNRPMHEWGAGGGLAKQFLSEVLPFLVVKKEQAKLLIEYLNLPWRSEGGIAKQGGARILRTREQKIIDIEYAIKISELNMKGNRRAGKKLEEMKALLETVSDSKYVYPNRERLINGRFK